MSELSVTCGAATVKIVTDSISPSDFRLTTIQARFPRMVHPELLTHRVMSRNGRSSRAVPSLTLLEEAMFPYIPHFLKNKPGMSATEEMDPQEFELAKTVWLEMARQCREGVEKLNALKVHKQWANRPLEWFGYIDVLITSTEWANFFALREDETAQPEIQDLARGIHRLIDLSEPDSLKPGEWHLPYVLPEERALFDLETLKKLSVARCARLSYKPFDGNASIEREIERYNSLVVSRPVHASPAEHQATPDEIMDWEGEEIWEFPDLHGNFVGWIQNRQTIPHHYIEG